jgi:hypothetical protein
MLLRRIWNEMVYENQQLSITGQLSNAEAKENRMYVVCVCFIYVQINKLAIHSNSEAISNK